MKFEREWEDAERIYARTCGDAHMLEFYLACLDEATRTRLRLQRDSRPVFSLVDAKRAVRAEFGGDALLRNQEAWQNLTVPLNGPLGYEVTFLDWRQFEAKFLELRAGMPGCDASFDYQAILLKLPPNMQEMLFKENLKRRDRKPWVRLTYPMGLAPTDVLYAVQDRLRGPLPQFTEFAMGFLFHATSEVEQARLLSLHRAQLGPFMLQVSKHEYQMTAEEVFSFITKKLKVQEELRPATAEGSVRPIQAMPAQAQGKVAGNQPQPQVRFTPGGGGQGHPTDQGGWFWQ